MTAEINKIGTRKTIEKSTKLRAGFDKINKIQNPLARQTKKEKTQINKIRSEREDITSDTT